MESMCISSILAENNESYLIYHILSKIVVHTPTSFLFS